MYSPFSEIKVATPDPILAVREQFLREKRASKVDLSVGIYQDENGQIKGMQAIDAAFKLICTDDTPVAYLPINGLSDFTAAVEELLFGAKWLSQNRKRVVTVQSVGGSAALRYGADFLKRNFQSPTVYLSDPSWENHQAIFEAAQFQIFRYPYLKLPELAVDFVQLVSTLQSAPDNSIILLHAACHNPSGVDLSLRQWKILAELFCKKRLIPLIDCAYQGLGEGLEQDVASVRSFAEAGLSFLVAYSCSKNFSLYSRRVGALAVVCADANQANAVLSQLKQEIRANHSTPPIDGALAVSLIWNTPELKQMWLSELEQMRIRIKSMRQGLYQLLCQADLEQPFSTLLQQKGLFSYTGLTPQQVDTLKKEYGIYALKNGRICLAALNQGNLAYVASAIAEVVKRK